MELRGAESGSMPRVKHQQSHCRQADEYDDSVEGRHDCLMILITPSELRDCPIQAMRLVGNGLRVPSLSLRAGYNIR